MTPLKMPDTTRNQLLSIIGLIVGLAVTQGLIDEGTAQTISGIAVAAVSLGLLIADAVIRNGRAQIAASQIAAEADAKKNTTTVETTPGQPVEVTSGTATTSTGGVVSGTWTHPPASPAKKKPAARKRGSGRTVPVIAKRPTRAQARKRAPAKKKPR